METVKNFDVIVLGSSISSTSMASVLAAQGATVLILEEGSHPRFAIGESMLPQTSMWMWIVGERFGVPELKTLAHAPSIHRDVSPACGVKRAIGFVYHHKDQPHDPMNSHQLVPPETPLFAESHLFREEVDHYMVRVAQKYGVQYRDRCRVRSLELADTGVELGTEDGTRYRARFLIDGTGSRSVVASKLDLREDPARQRTRSRAIFNHFEGVRAFDEVLNVPGSTARRWHEGTLHHVFDGGWIWVIPFDNHASAKNPLCSVGLMLREERFPSSGRDPEEEFFSIVQQFPTIAEHFKSAKPIRKWVSSERIQYSSSRSTGARFALLSNAYGFIDPLYSTGLVSTFESIYALASRLLEALRTDDFRAESFAYVEQLQKHQIDDSDALIFNAYRSMSSFETWNAWTQLLLATVLFGDTYVFGHCLRYLASGDLSAFDPLEEEPAPKAQAPFAEDMRRLLQFYDDRLTQAEAGDISWADAGTRMLAELRAAAWLPKEVYAWGAPDARHGDINAVFKNWLQWGMAESPEAFRRRLFNFDPSVLARVASAPAGPEDAQAV